MLRALIAALLIANLAFLAWTQGLLGAVVSARPTGDREPERLQRQVRPELIRILPASAAAALGAPAALACFEAGPFTDAELGAAQAAAQAALPAGTWAALVTEKPGTWIVYMGRYATREALKTKEDELKRRAAPFEAIDAPPALAPGFSLGRFDQRAAAVAALDQVTLQGIRTARVVELAAPASRHVLRVERADAALSTRLAALKGDGLGAGFAACARGAGG